MTASHSPARRIPVTQLEVPLDRDVFMRGMVSELSGVLEDVVGLEEASGFISIVGQNIGNQMDLDYRRALGVAELPRERLAEVLVDLKARIEGDFYVIEDAGDRIVLGNRACPFGDKVLNRPSMCMMTSNVFGVIAAQNLGYAKVAVEEAIARGHGGCRVVVYLQATEETEAAAGQEYFRTGL